MKMTGLLSAVMKGCMILLFALNTSDLLAQISVKGRNLTAVEAIRQIEKGTDWTFLYNASDISALKAKDMDVNGDIETVLNALFEGTGVSWQIKGNEVMLKTDFSKEPVAQSQKGRKRVVTGFVTDSNDGQPVIGAGVFVKGTNDGTVTDVDGAFTISFSGKSCELVVSYLGYKDQTLYITDQGMVDVALTPDTEMLSEVIVIGAGTQKKVSVTGSVTAIKGDQLRAPTSSLSSSFAGKLAGVISMTTSGEPGSSSEFYIRGISTFGGRATPLIILDGVEISTSDLDNIPSESIESFSILKDASATAIYGARGANGVMIVTTKDGTMNSKAKVNVTLENSFLQPMNMVDYVDGATWMEIYNEAQLTRTPDATPKFDSYLIDLTRAGTSPYLAPDVDWQDLMFKKMTMNQRANVNVQGGGSRVTYYLGLQANHDTGLLKVPQTHSFDNNINRWLYVFQNNISYKLTNTTKVDLKMNAQIGRFKGPGTSTSELFRYTYLANPINFPAFYPAQEGDTHVRYGSEWLTEGSTRLINPYAEMCKSFKEQNSSTLNTTLKINQLLDFITEGLSVTALVNFKSYASSYYTQTLEPYYYRVLDASTDDNLVFERVGTSGTEYVSDSQITKQNNSTLYIDARIDYNRVFGGKHYVTGMLMYMQREYRSSIYPNRNQGLSGRFTYDYRHRYLAELNFGYNGTERLARGDRFEFFPAMSLGWVVSEEPFWNSLKGAVDYFKIRGSYGLVGSDETGLDNGAAHFLYLDTVGLKNGTGFQTGYGSYGSFLQGPKVSAYAVAGATWEKVRKLDIGVDLTFFEQLDITFDYFYDHRYDILMKRASWPDIMGYGSAVPWSNIGEVDNWGVELSLNWKKELFKDFIIDLRGNFTYNRNKYVNIDEPDYPYVWKSLTGQPLSHTMGYIAEGLFSSYEEIKNSPEQNLGSEVMPGDIKYRDVSGDGMITEDDMVIISDYGKVPRIQYGFGLNITWKKLDVGVFFNGAAQRTIMISGISPFFSDASYGERNLMSFIAEDYWSEANPNPAARYPRLGVTNSQVANNIVESSYWMRNGSYLRFKTLELGYRFPHCRVFLNGDNIAVWSPFKLWDPELNYNSYPLSRTFNIGVQLNF